MLAAFEDGLSRLYSRVIPGVEVEVLSWVLLLSGPVPETAPPPPSRRASYPEPARRRAVFDPDSAEFVEVAIHERAALSPGAVIPGRRSSSRTRPRPWSAALSTARIDAWGYIELTRKNP